MAVILAGGLGTRIQHLLPNVPKPMAPVAGRPCIEWLVRYLAEARPAILGGQQTGDLGLEHGANHKRLRDALHTQVRGGLRPQLGLDLGRQRRGGHFSRDVLVGGGRGRGQCGGSSA